VIIGKRIEINIRKLVSKEWKRYFAFRKVMSNQYQRESPAVVE
jgi:hypothetical protein